MSPTRRLHDLGQSLWLDNVLLSEGTLARYAREFDVTGLTSNATILRRHRRARRPGVAGGVAAARTRQSSGWRTAVWCRRRR